MSRQKRLDTDLKAVQQIEFIRKLMNTNGENANDAQTMLVLKMLEEVEETQLKFSQGSVAT